jgi:hypothetical protein
MPKLSHWATRIALIAAATGGIVVACYDEVPAPSAPLPPTREAKPLGPKPNSFPLKPIPMKKPSVVAQKTEIEPALPANTAKDGGVGDVINLPPVRDASGLDAPLIKQNDLPDPDARLDAPAPR